MDQARLDLGLAAPQILLASIAYLVAAGVSAPIGVVLGRRYSNTVAATSAVLMLVGVMLGTLAADYALLMVGRTMSGLAAGALLAETVVLALRAGRGRTHTIGLMAGLGTLALVLGPLLGQMLATTLAWRWAFLMPLPLIILALLATIASGIILVTSRPANH
jgi:predicted MFS family arabinose efflux permease